MTDDVRVAAADAQIVLRVCELLRDLVFVAPRSAIVHLDDAYALRYAEFFQVRGHANPLASRVTGHRDGVVLLAGLQHARQRQMNI